MIKKLFIINIGSTSTKVAYCEGTEFILRDTIEHPSDALKKCPAINDQFDLRRKAILDYMNEHSIDPSELDSFVSRGGQTEPINGGVWQINDAYVKQTSSGKYGNHPCNLGSMIALNISKEYGTLPLTVDPPTTDEMEPLARYSGLKEIPRVSCLQALNTKAMARYYAEQNGKNFEDVRLITVMLGGGISVAAIKNGRMIDAPNSLEGDGPFSNNRCCTVPAGELVKLCYSGKYDLNGMMRHINGEAGLMSYLDTTDIREIMDRIENGDKYAEEVMEAMCYQTAKEIGAMGTVLLGNVDAILLVGGMANVQFIVDHISKRVDFIAPVVVIPGEREMDSLAINSYEALIGKREIQQFVPSKG